MFRDGLELDFEIELDLFSSRSKIYFLLSNYRKWLKSARNEVMEREK